MRFSVFQLLCATFMAASTVLRAATPAAAPKNLTQEPVWQASLPAFDEATYEKQVELMIANFEKVSGKKLVPGAKKKAGRAPGTGPPRSGSKFTPTPVPEWRRPCRS